jgi:hypothetical protein
MTTCVGELCGIAGALRLISKKEMVAGECAYLFELYGGRADKLAADIEANGVTDGCIAELDELAGALRGMALWREMEGCGGYLCRVIADRCGELASQLDAMS